MVGCSAAWRVLRTAGSKEHQWVAQMAVWTAAKTVFQKAVCSAVKRALHWAAHLVGYLAGSKAVKMAGSKVLRSAAQKAVLTVAKTVFQKAGCSAVKRALHWAALRVGCLAASKVSQMAGSKAHYLVAWRDAWMAVKTAFPKAGCSVHS